jgi:hypothetical protein
MQEKRRAYVGTSRTAAIRGPDGGNEGAGDSRAAPKGWTDSEMVVSLMLLNLAGGDHVSDIRVLESDEGFRENTEEDQQSWIAAKEERELERRWRKEKERAVPSERAMFRCLAKFHDAEQEKQRLAGVAFIPKSNAHLQGFLRICKEFVEHGYVGCGCDSG